MRSGWHGSLLLGQTKFRNGVISAGNGRVLAQKNTAVTYIFEVKRLQKLRKPTNLASTTAEADTASDLGYHMLG